MRETTPKPKPSRHLLRALRKDVRGLAAIEFALIGGFLSMAVLNLSDICVYALDKQQLDNATEMGAQAAWANCDLNHIPATVKCGNLTNAVTTAIHGTSLGGSVALQAGYPSEGYYCVNAGGTLQMVSDVSTRPADCSAAGNASAAPGDFVQIKTSYSYTPIFPGLTVLALMPANMQSTSWMRLG